MALENVMRVDNGNIVGGKMPDTYPASHVMMSDGETSVEDAVDELTRKSFSVYILSQSLTVSANAETTTTIDWTGIDKSKVLYSWVWWSNQSLDDPAKLPKSYYDSRPNAGCVKTFVHKWAVAQQVNLKVSYIYCDN